MCSAYGCGSHDRWHNTLRGSGPGQNRATVGGTAQPGHTPTYPGPTLVAHTGTEIKVNWQNKLRSEVIFCRTISQSFHMDVGTLG
jgi:hypothetical protein